MSMRRLCRSSISFDAKYLRVNSQRYSLSPANSSGYGAKYHVSTSHRPSSMHRILRTFVRASCCVSSASLAGSRPSVWGTREEPDVAASNSLGFGTDTATRTTTAASSSSSSCSRLADDAPLPAASADPEDEGAVLSPPAPLDGCADSSPRGRLRLLEGALAAARALACPLAPPAPIDFLERFLPALDFSAPESSESIPAPVSFSASAA